MAQKGRGLLYGESSRLIGTPLAHLFSKLPIISALYGWWQKQPWTKKKIGPFIEGSRFDTSGVPRAAKQFFFLQRFFHPQIKGESRPLAPGANTAIIPADGRYRFIPNIADADGFIVKGEKFSLAELLGDAQLADAYAEGSMAIGGYVQRLPSLPFPLPRHSRPRATCQRASVIC